MHLFIECPSMKKNICWQYSKHGSTLTHGQQTCRHNACVWQMFFFSPRNWRNTPKSSNEYFCLMHINRYRNETFVKLRNERCIILHMCFISMPCLRNLRKSHWEQCEQESYPHYLWRNDGHQTETNNFRFWINKKCAFLRFSWSAFTRYNGIQALLHSLFFLNKAYCTAIQISK